MVVNEAGQNLLAGTRRPIDKDRDIGLRDTARQRQKITADLVTTGHRPVVRQHCGG